MELQSELRWLRAALLDSHEQIVRLARVEAGLPERVRERPTKQTPPPEVLRLARAFGNPDLGGDFMRRAIQAHDRGEPWESIIARIEQEMAAQGVVLYDEDEQED